MAIIKNLIEAKSNGRNYLIEGNDTVLKALELMAEANISALMVTEGEKIIGIFTERDYSRKGELKGLSAKVTLVRDMMTEDMITVTLETSVDQCMALMKKYRIRHLPVIENGAMVGMVSMRDVVDVMISDRENTIKGLENYILGSGFAT